MKFRCILGKSPFNNYPEQKLPGHKKVPKFRGTSQTLSIKIQICPMWYFRFRTPTGF